MLSYFIKESIGFEMKGRETNKFTNVEGNEAPGRLACRKKEAVLDL